MSFFLMSVLDISSYISSLFLLISQSSLILSFIIFQYFRHLDHVPQEWPDRQKKAVSSWPQTISSNHFFLISHTVLLYTFILTKWGTNACWPSLTFSFFSPTVLITKKMLDWPLFNEIDITSFHVLFSKNLNIIHSESIIWSSFLVKQEENKWRDIHLTLCWPDPS